MTSGQWRVFAIVLVALGVEIAASKETRAVVVDLLRLQLKKDEEPQGLFALIFGYTIGALALVALAAVADGVATMLALLFLLIVLLNRGDVIGPVVLGASNAVSNLTRGQ